MTCTARFVLHGSILRRTLIVGACVLASACFQTPVALAQRGAGHSGGAGGHFNSGGPHGHPTCSRSTDFTSKDFAASSFRRSASGLPWFRISAAPDFSPPRVPPSCVLWRTVFAGGPGIQFFLVPDLRSFLDLGIQLTPQLVWV